MRAISSQRWTRVLCKDVPKGSRSREALRHASLPGEVRSKVAATFYGACWQGAWECLGSLWQAGHCTLVHSAATTSVSINSQPRTPPLTVEAATQSPPGGRVRQ